MSCALLCAHARAQKTHSYADVRDRLPCRSYAIICGGVSIASALLQPSILIIAAIVGGVFYGAVEWGDRRPIPILDQTLTYEQRVGAAAMASSVIVHSSGTSFRVTRIALFCAGLVLCHAAFRARSISSRWNFFKDQVENKVD